MSTAWVGLGSNQGQSAAILSKALQALDRHPEIELTAVSSLYRTPPWGVTDQDDFLNAVVRLKTTLAPEALLDRLLSIEQSLGRTRDGPRWGPRTLDLDLLLIDEQVIELPRLQVPHPRLHLRAFVLVPLAELAPDLLVPGQGLVKDLLPALEPSERADIKWSGPLEYHREP